MSLVTKYGTDSSDIIRGRGFKAAVSTVHPLCSSIQYNHLFDHAHGKAACTHPARPNQNPIETTDNISGTTSDPSGTTENPVGPTSNPSGTTQDPSGVITSPSGTKSSPTESTAWSLVSGPCI